MKSHESSVFEGVFLTCATCGSVMSIEAPEGLCVRCLLGAVLVPETQRELDPLASPSEMLLARRHFGAYELLEEIGRGGMGIVFKARQSRPDRLVALKVVASGELSSPQLIERFRREAEAAGGLNHPNLVSIHEVGVQGGWPYFSMRLVDGPTLSAANQRERFTPLRSAQIVQKAALAVQYAHEHGVLHRDLKPGNVMLDAEGEPHITDFGLAKVAGHESQLTATHAVLGTPSYMAPELASGSIKSVTTATDTYGLGAILYELLTGQPPFRGETALETVRKVVDTEPVPLRRWVPSLDVNLETICLKCLQKDPKRRYASAAALAEDLGRWMEHKPIHARATPVWERLMLWARRRPTLAMAGGVIVVLMMAVLLISTRLNLRLSKANIQAERDHYFRTLSVAQKLSEDGQLTRSIQTLLTCPENLRGWEWGWQMWTCHPETLTLETGETNLASLQMTADGKCLVTLSRSGRLRMWDLAARALQGEVPEVTNRVLNYFGGGSNGLGSVWFADGSVQKWDGRSGFREWLPVGTVDRMMAASPDGTLYATVSRNQPTRIWSSADGSLVSELEAEIPLDTRGVWFSPDNRSLIATFLYIEQVPGAMAGRVWDVKTGREVRRFGFPAVLKRFGYNWFSSDATHCALVVADDAFEVWDIVESRLKIRSSMNGLELRSFAWSPDARRLTLRLMNDSVRVWDVVTGKELLNIPHKTTWSGFSPDGNYLVTHGEDPVATVWNLKTGESTPLRGNPGTIHRVVFDEGSRRVAIFSGSGTVKVWDLDRVNSRVQVGDWVHQTVFSPDGQRAITGEWDRLARVWDLQSGVEVLRLAGHRHAVMGVAFSPDGRRIATGSADRTVKIWDAVTGRELLGFVAHPRVVNRVRFSPDGTRLATSSWDGTARIWDSTRATLLATLEGHGQPVRDLVYRGDGRLLATAGADGTARTWEAAGGKPVRVFRGHERSVEAVGFSPDGETLVTASLDGTLKLWDVRSGEVRRTLGGRTPFRGVVFTPDGKRLIASNSETSAAVGRSTAGIWDVETGLEMLTIPGLEGGWECMDLSRDGGRMLSSGSDRYLRITETLPWKNSSYGSMRGRELPERIRSLSESRFRVSSVAEGSTRGLGGESWIPFGKAGGPWPARDPSTSTNALDLTPYYNGWLDVAWEPARRLDLVENDLFELEPGLKRWGGVEFDVRGVIQLANEQAEYVRRYPQSVPGIAVGRRCQRLHFIHAGSHGVTAGSRIGTYVLHYADGGRVELPVVTDQDLFGWWGKHGRLGPGASVVWNGSSDSARLWNEQLRLVHRVWDNPRPEIPIREIELRSVKNYSAPLVLAVTLE